ncbi:MAG: LysR substrate-binding domain-containing protein [Azospirillaceae bacterium]|nr:LysR substrate-binding domain-containing protein [Azospirillaceae bacterium]
MRIPSTQALRALDAFARYGTVWQAADELNLTRSAVSHQLRALEAEVGFALVERAGKGARLTVRGRRYADDVRKALDLLDQAATGHREGHLGGTLTVSCTAGLGSLWLCPKIGAFRDLYPDAVLRIVTPRRPDEVEGDDVDLFIAFGTGQWPDYTVELAGTVELTPLCSPAFLNRVGGFTDPSELLAHPLLHLVDFDDWQRWSAAARIKAPRVERGIVFADLNLVLAAASTGQGIAIGDELTCGRALAEGLLVRPFDISVRSVRAYYLVTSPKKVAAPLVIAFMDWLRRDFGSMNSAPTRA